MKETIIAPPEKLFIFSGRITEANEGKALAYCNTCFHNCMIPEGKRGACGGRENRDGQIIPVYYGKVCALSLDPIEKKPLYEFMPGKRIPLHITRFFPRYRRLDAKPTDISLMEQLREIALKKLESVYLGNV